MDEPEQQRCEACGESRASHFVCRAGIDKGPSRKLCASCYEASLSGPEKAFVDAMRKGRCRFCGGRAMATDSISSVLEGAGATPQFLCGSCSVEYHRQMLAVVAKAGSDLENASDREQTQQLRRLKVEIDSEMQRWVQQRDN